MEFFKVFFKTQNINVFSRFKFLTYCWDWNFRNFYEFLNFNGFSMNKIFNTFKKSQHLIQRICHVNFINTCRETTLSLIRRLKRLVMLIIFHASKFSPFKHCWYENILKIEWLTLAVHMLKGDVNMWHNIGFGTCDEWVRIFELTHM